MIAKSKQTIVRERDELINARKHAIEIELNSLYSHCASHKIKIQSIANSTIDFHVMIQSFINNEKYVDALIVRYDVTTKSIHRNFATFIIVDEIDDDDE